MFRRMCFLVFVALLVPMFLSSFGEAAHFNVITDSPSWYYGQRGAGVLVEVSEGSWHEPFEETRFGDLTLYGPDPYDPYPIQWGDGRDEIESNWTYTSVSHGLSIAYGDYGNNKSQVDIWQTSSAYSYVDAGDMSPVTHVQITDDWFGVHGAYADATVVQAMQIEADEGESVGNPVRVTVSTTCWWEPSIWGDPAGPNWIEGIVSGSGGTGGFTVYRKDSNGEILETYSYGDTFLDFYQYLYGDQLRQFTIDAAIGDLIEVDSGILSRIYLDAYNEDGSGIDWEGSAWLELYTTVDVASSPVPIPAAVWLLGSGLLGLGAMRRRSGKV